MLFTFFYLILCSDTAVPNVATVTKQQDHQSPQMIYGSFLMIKNIKLVEAEFIVALWRKQIVIPDGRHQQHLCGPRNDSSCCSLVVSSFAGLASWMVGFTKFTVPLLIGSVPVLTAELLRRRNKCEGHWINACFPCWRWSLMADGSQLWIGGYLVQLCRLSVWIKHQSGRSGISAHNLRERGWWCALFPRGSF